MISSLTLYLLICNYLISTKPLGKDQYYFVLMELGMIDYISWLKKVNSYQYSVHYIFRAPNFDNLNNLTVAEVKSFEYQLGNLTC